METNTSPILGTTAPSQPTSTPISNIFKSNAKTAEPAVSTFKCNNCEDSGKTCSVCGFDRE